jgi:hypothetical protein
LSFVNADAPFSLFICFYLFLFYRRLKWKMKSTQQGPGPAKRSTPGTLAVAGAEATSGVVPWQEDFVFEGVKASEQVTVTCYLHRRSLASAAGGGDGLGLGEWRWGGCVSFGPMAYVSGSGSLTTIRPTPPQHQVVAPCRLLPPPR